MITKIKVRQLRDVDCPDCDGNGEWRECYGDLIEDGDCGLNEDIVCRRCDGTGRLEIDVEYCPVCGLELAWDDMEFGFDEETMSIFRCLENKCDKKKVKI